MKYVKNLRGFTTSLGLRVILTLTAESKTLVVSRGPVSRREVTIHLPTNSSEKWPNIVRKALTTLEGGDKWTVRMDWEQVRQFFTLKELHQLEQNLPGIPFCLYNAPKQFFSSSLDVDSLYDAKNRAKYHAKYIHP